MKTEGHLFTGLQELAQSSNSKIADEVHLATCLLLTTSSSSFVQNHLLSSVSGKNEEDSLLSYIERLLECAITYPKDDTSNEFGRTDLDHTNILLCRVGIRLLSHLYLSVSESSSMTTAEKKHLAIKQIHHVTILAKIISSQARENMVIGILDVDILQLLVFIFVYLDRSSANKSGIDDILYQQEVSKIWTQLPETVFQRYISDSMIEENNNSNSCTDSSKRGIVSPMEDGQEMKNSLSLQRGMNRVISSVLDTDAYRIQPHYENITDAFQSTMVAFFQSHLRYGKKSPSSMGATRRFVLDVIDWLTSTTHRVQECPKFCADMHIIVLSYSMLSSPDVMDVVQVGSKGSLGSGASISHHLAADLCKKGGDIESTKSLQKFIIYGLSSLSDSQTKSWQIGEDDSSLLIRTMTAKLVSSLIDSCGLHWMQSFRSQEDEKNNGSIFLTISRLVSGELRMILGNVVDQRYSLEDENTFELIQNAMTNCIEIMLGVLSAILQLSTALEVDSDHFHRDKLDSTIPFDLNSDMILYIRDSLEDTLDSVMQFLLAERVDNTRRYLAFECCRFLGAYLSEIDVFEYKSVSTSFGEKNKAACLLQSVRNGIAVCRILDQDLFERFPDRESASENIGYSSTSMHRSYTITLVPCVNTILNGCENEDRGLLENFLEGDLISSMLCLIVEHCNFILRDEEVMIRDDVFESIETLHQSLCWCNVTLTNTIRFYGQEVGFATMASRRKLLTSFESISEVVGLLIKRWEESHCCGELVSSYSPKITDVIHQSIQTAKDLDKISSQLDEQWDGKSYIEQLRAYLMLLKDS